MKGYGYGKGCPKCPKCCRKRYYKRPYVIGAAAVVGMGLVVGVAGYLLRRKDDDEASYAKLLENAEEL